MTKNHCDREFTRFIWWMHTELRVAANPQTNWSGLWSAENWQLPSTSTIATVIITQPVSLYSFCRPMEGGRLSRPVNCSKGAQPVPKAACRSGCRDKRNRPRCNSNPGSVTPQSGALTTRPLRPAVERYVKNCEVTSTRRPRSLTYPNPSHPLAFHLRVNACLRRFVSLPILVTIEKPCFFYSTERQTDGQTDETQ